MKLLGLSMMLAGMAISWLVFIYGWGLTPVSWAWIIGGAIATIFCMGVGQVLAGEK